MGSPDASPNLPPWQQLSRTISSANGHGAESKCLLACCSASRMVTVLGLYQAPAIIGIEMPLEPRQSTVPQWHYELALACQAGLLANAAAQVSEQNQYSLLRNRRRPAAARLSTGALHTGSSGVALSPIMSAKEKSSMQLRTLLSGTGPSSTTGMSNRLAASAIVWVQMTSPA